MPDPKRVENLIFWFTCNTHDCQVSPPDGPPVGKGPDEYILWLSAAGRDLALEVLAQRERLVRFEERIANLIYARNCLEIEAQNIIEHEPEGAEADSVMPRVRACVKRLKKDLAGVARLVSPEKGEHVVDAVARRVETGTMGVSPEVAELRREKLAYATMADENLNEAEEACKQRDRAVDRVAAIHASIGGRPSHGFLGDAQCIEEWIADAKEEPVACPTCVGILRADARRHFKGCPEREETP